MNKVVQALLYGLYPTVGETIEIDVTSTEVDQLLKGPGIYEITNLGPDIVHVRMLANGATLNATTSDKRLAPFMSGERSSFTVLVSDPKSRYSPHGPNVVHAVCDTGKTAKLEVTLMSRHN